MKEKLQIASRILEQENIQYHNSPAGDAILLSDNNINSHILRRLLDVGLVSICLEYEDYYGLANLRINF